MVSGQFFVAHSNARSSSSGFTEVKTLDPLPANVCPSFYSEGHENIMGDREGGRYSVYCLCVVPPSFNYWSGQRSC